MDNNEPPTQLEEIRAKVGELLQQLDELALERQTMLDLLWMKERESYAVTLNLRRAYRQINFLTSPPPETADIDTDTAVSGHP